MTRLTNPIRVEVLNSILKKTFDKRIQKIIAAEAKLAIKVRDLWLGEHKRVYLKLSPRLQVHRNSMQVNPKRMGKAYDRYDLSFIPKSSLTTSSCHPNSSAFRIQSTGQVPVGGDRYTQMGKDELGELLIEVVMHIELVEKLQADVRKLHNKIAAQLRACTTIKKLNETWPEVVTYVPRMENPPSIIVDRTGVNEMIACMKADNCT